MPTLRNTAIDVLKGQLVIAMVTAHVIQLLGSDSNAITYSISWAANFVCFSGFLFAFGYASQLAYFSKPTFPWRRLVATAFRIMVAYYVCAATHLLLVDKPSLDVTVIWNLLSLNEIRPYCEFLPAFALVILLTTVCHFPLAWCIHRPIAASALIGALLLCTLIPYEQVTVPQLGLLIGTKLCLTFPVVQYLPLFLMGMLVARYQVGYRKQLLGLAAVALASFFWHNRHDELERFPPAFMWIVGSMAATYLAYLLSLTLNRFGHCRRELIGIGTNALFYLVASNLALFAIQSAHPHHSLDALPAIAVSILLLGSIRYCSSIVRPAFLGTTEDTESTEREKCTTEDTESTERRAPQRAQRETAREHAMS